MIFFQGSLNFLGCCLCWGQNSQPTPDNVTEETSVEETSATEETDPTPVGGDVLDAPSVTEENTVEETSATEEIGGEN